MKIAYIIAMEAEAQPFIEHYGVVEQKDFFAPLPSRLFKADGSKWFNGSKGSNELYVVLNGQQHGSDLVGCEAASVATLAAIERIQPDIVINSGTCGAFKRNGAEIGKVYIANGVMFHDRRVPGDDEWGTQALGNYPVWEGSKAMAEKLCLPMGKVTTGSSLDMQPCDEQIIMDNHGELKDMEGAAVAFVCSLTHTPIILVKSVTDLCDSGAKTFEEFKRNLALASEELRKANIKVIDYLVRG